MRVGVVVLGDIGRSPRMQYHAVSLSKMKNVKVSMVGYRESEVHPLVNSNKKIDIHPLKPFPFSMSRGIPGGMIIWPFIAIIKVMFQILQLFFTMMTLPRDEELKYILVQSPPSIPVVLVLQLVCLLRRVKLIIDWHNLGYTLLQLSLHKSESHPIIRCAKMIERIGGKNAYAHLFVTGAMRSKLSSEWDLKGERLVFHDRPPPIFKSLTVNEQNDFLENVFLKKYVKSEENGERDFITSIIQSRSSGGIIVSSTSWTEDEDFGILLDAINQYESDPSCKKPLLFVITGKGAKRDYYMNRVKEMNLKKSRVISVWLDQCDYPLLLGSCDLGVSLHNSSSGIDLPMKVVDMFGCCLPVLAVNFKCISELVIDNQNGFIFNDSKELFNNLLNIFNSNNKYLSTFKSNLIKDRNQNSWDMNWDSIVKPLIK